MKGIQKLLLATALIALLATGLAGCGDGDSSDSTATSTTRESSPTAGGGGQEAKDGEGADDDGSASFRTPGGDNSIQDFGKEAGAKEAAEAESNLRTYLDARASLDWAAQCRGLAKTAAAPLEELASRSSQLKGKDCAAILESLLGSSPRSTFANTLNGGIASFRFQGDRGFVLYHGAKGVDYFVPMVKEGGEWKIGAISPSEFP
jgi:hypothetical protein